ncbi:MAG: FMN-binding protein [Candidatus Weimeria sp.]
MHELSPRILSLILICFMIFFYNGMISRRQQDADNLRKAYAQASADAAEKTEAVRQYRDGSYEGSGQGFGGPIKVKVTISDDRIKSIEVLSHDGEDNSYFSMASQLTEQIVKAQRTAVDTVSGATYSSKGIISAVENALSKAADS